MINHAAEILRPMITHFVEILRPMITRAAEILQPMITHATVKKRKTSLLMALSLHISEKGNTEFKCNRNEMITHCKLQ